MTASRTAAPSVYVSGLCHSRTHDRCRGEYAGCVCTCSCHSEPDEPEPPVAPPVPAPTRHCPTCTCEVA